MQAAGFLVFVGGEAENYAEGMSPGEVKIKNKCVG